MMAYSIQQLLADVKSLGVGNSFPYVNSDQKICKLDAVDDGQQRISFTFTNNTTTPPTVENGNFTQDKLQLVANALSAGNAINIDAVLNGGGNKRAVLESFLAHTEHVFVCYVNGAKHIFWSSQYSHDGGKMCYFAPGVTLEKYMPASQMETEFKQWLVQQPSRGQSGLFGAGPASMYCNGLKTCLQDPVFAKVFVKNLFEVQDAACFEVLVNTIKKVPGYNTYNLGWNNQALNAAMGKYKKYLDAKAGIMSVTGNGASALNSGFYIFLAAIRTKPFILLAGISGTGKSRIVRQLARGCCPEKKDGQPHPLRDEQKPGNFELISVRPNWHDSTELMGYVTRITGTGRPKYVLTPFVKFLVKAWLHKDVPFFLCLDEMNLAPVEQYFAEYLSKIESRKLSGGDIVTDVLVEFPEEILDSVLSEISQEFPLVATTKQMGGDAKPEARKRDKDSLYKLWDEFLAEWPISRLREMGLEEYTKAGSTDTFTYALEAKLANLGSIWGGSAFKFGIFSRDPNGKLKDYNPNSKQIGTSEYAWYRKFGLTRDAAWNTVKEKIVSIAEAAASGNFAAVDKIDFPHVVKWKVAFLYQDRKNIKIVDIFKREWILLLTAGMPQNASFAERYLKLNEERRSMDVFEWDDKILTKRRAELLASDGDFDGDEEEESTPADAWVQSPVLAMIKRDKGIRIPSNLVVMGTVNMDETTCSFSRKVLDRAMSFELNDVEGMYTISTDGDPDVEWGAFNNGVDNRAKQTYVTAENLYAEADATKKAANMAIGEKVLAYLKAINAVLDKTPFKVAYRTRNEMMLYCVERGGDLAKALDEVTSMKILSRIEGDENAVRVTNKLVESAAVVPTPLPNNAPKNLMLLLKLVILKQLGVVDGTVTNAAVAPSVQEYETLEGKYKICAAKLDEMNDRLLSGYTGFWR